MSYRFIHYELKDAAAYITLNRPDAGNTLTELLVQELRDICQELSQNNEAKIVILKGAGVNIFCSGNDLEQNWYSGTTTVSLDYINSLISKYGVSSSIASIECPVIAAISGDALGGGLELALACDLRISVSSARFGFPYIASGIIPSDGGTQRLPRLIGKGRAMEMVLTGKLIDAQEALQIGLLNKVTTLDRLDAEIHQIVTKVREAAPIAMKYAKEAINKGSDLTLEQGLRLEADLYFLLHTTQDRTEGITAFRNKKSPQFKGK